MHPMQNRTQSWVPRTSVRDICLWVFIMASPQLENGYTKIANEIFEALATVKMSGSEWQYVMCIFRKVYGFNKKEDWISNSQIVEMTTMEKERVSEAKTRLLARKIIIEYGGKVAFQKDYQLWKELRKNVTGVTEKRNKLLRNSVHTKETKETIQKKYSKRGLQVNKKNMFNTKSDDYLEGEIDLDTGDLTPAEKPKTKKYPNAKPVFNIFKEVLGRYPKNWDVNKTQLRCAENLSTERGLVQIKKALLSYQERKDEKFCPQIHSPYDLDSKWTNLYKFVNK